MITLQRGRLPTVRQHLLISFGFLALTTVVAEAEAVRIKWKAGDAHLSRQAWVKYGSVEINGWSERFMDGTVEEKGKIATEGYLEADIRRPKNSLGPIPFVILMHGCSGLNDQLKRWAHETSAAFLSKGIGVLILDSFKTRGVAVNNSATSGICRDPSQLNWARRRADDAYAALDHLIETRTALPGRVFLLGRSNGATTTLIALNRTAGEAHKHRFAGGFALQPSCRYHLPDTFYSPVRLYLAELDDAVSTPLCMKLAQITTDRMLTSIVFKGAFHGYQDKVPKHTFNGWRMGYDAAAATATMKDIISITTTQSLSHR